MAEIEETEDQAAAENRPASTRAQDRNTLKEMSPTRRVISLALGDAVVFLVFASLGQGSHGESLSIQSIIFIALPFALGWFLVSPFVGAFRSDVLTHQRLMTNRTIQAWFLSWPVAMALRWLLVDRVNNTPFSQFITFAFVALLIIMVILLVWRWPYALNNSIRQKEVR